MNYLSKKLSLVEKDLFNKDEKIKKRVLLSYKMMLDFYGLTLVDEETGQVERADNYKSRYANLVNSSHNWLRITRILKSLGDLGFKNFKSPLLLHFCKEIIENNELTDCCESLMNFWLDALKIDEQEEIKNYLSIEKNSVKIKHLIDERKKLFSKRSYRRSKRKRKTTYKKKNKK